MKIFNSAQIRELDDYTIRHEAITSLDLMERAAKATRELSCNDGRQRRLLWSLLAGKQRG